MDKIVEALLLSKKRFIGDLLSIKPISYAPRKIYANQSTPWAIARNASGVEIDIRFDGSGWADTAQLLDHAAGGNVTIKQIYEPTFGYHAVENTVANQPLIVENGVLNTINGRPALRSDSTRRLTANNPSLAQPNYLSAVAHNPAFTGSAEIFLDGRTTRNTIFYNSATSLGYFGGSTVVSGATTANIPLIWGAFISGASSYLRINGAQLVSGNAGTNGMSNIVLMSDGFAYNSSFSLNGFLSEAYIFNGFPSAADIALLERNQGVNYGIAIG